MGDDARNETFSAEDDAAVLGLEPNGEEADSGQTAVLDEPITEPKTAATPAAAPAAPAQPKKLRKAVAKPAAPAAAAAPAAPATQIAPAQPAQPAPAQKNPLAQPSPYGFPLLQAKDLGSTLQAFKDNFGPRGLTANDLETITVPQGGGTQWQLETLEGKKELRDELVIIAVHWGERRAYWPASIAGHQPPVCSSDDCVTGRGDPGGLCDECPLGAFGSSEKPGSNAPACRMSRMLFALLANDTDQKLPTRIQIPPTSIPDNRKFFGKLAARGVSFYQVVLSLTLTEQEGPMGKYSIVHEKVVRRATEVEIKAVLAYRSAIGGALSHVKAKIVNE